MTIAYIFAYFGDGGAEEHAKLLAGLAAADDNKVIFIISSGLDTTIAGLVDAGFNVIRIPMESSFNPVAVIKSALKLKQVIRDNKIDIIHSHMLREQSLGAIAKLLGARFKLVRTFHRFDQFNWKMRPLMAFYNKFTDSVIAISQGMVEYLKSNGLTDKVELINNGVAQIKCKNHAKSLGFIGRLTDEKGILRFVQANIGMLKKTKLVIAGDGPNGDVIKQLVDDGKLNVTMLGRVENKADFYEKTSVLVLPSRTEVMPLVVLEAYSCGLPVAGFKIDALVDLVTSENGELVECQNYELLGQRATTLLGKSDGYSQVNQAKYESQYSANIMWGQTSALYKQLLGK